MNFSAEGEVLDKGCEESENEGGEISVDDLRQSSSFWGFVSGGFELYTEVAARFVQFKRSKELFAVQVDAFFTSNYAFFIALLCEK